MPITTEKNITNLQLKVIGPARMTLKDDVLAIKGSYHLEQGNAGMNDTYNSPKLPGVTAYGLTEGVDMNQAQTLVDSNVAVTATETGAQVLLTNKMLRTINSGDFLRRAGMAMGSGVNVKEEQDFATLISGLSNVVGSDAAAATLGNLSAGLAQLRANVEPVNEAMMRDVSAIVAPYSWNKLTAQFFPAGEGASRTPVAQMNSVNERQFNSYLPAGEYLGIPIKVSNNLVTSSTNIRNGIVFREQGLIYEFMPVDMETEEDKSLRAIEMNMVVDYGYGSLNDGFSRVWKADNQAPTS